LYVVVISCESARCCVASSSSSCESRLEFMCKRRKDGNAFQLNFSSMWKSNYSTPNSKQQRKAEREEKKKCPRRIKTIQFH
jgi:hypothetical protein